MPVAVAVAVAVVPLLRDVVGVLPGAGVVIGLALVVVEQVRPPLIALQNASAAGLTVSVRERQYGNTLGADQPEKYVPSHWASPHAASTQFSAPWRMVWWLLVVH